MSFSVDASQCEKCLYRASRTARRDMGNNCAYIFLMNHRRPSEPSPNCTAFRKYNYEERQQLEFKREIEELFTKREE